MADETQNETQNDQKPNARRTKSAGTHSVWSEMSQADLWRSADFRVELAKIRAGLTEPKCIEVLSQVPGTRVTDAASLRRLLVHFGVEIY